MIFEISTQETCPWYHELIVSFKHINNFRREIIRWPTGINFPVVHLHQRKDEMRAIWILVAVFDFFCGFVVVSVVSNNVLKFHPLEQINHELQKLVTKLVCNGCFLEQLYK
jgi:hypothetical protein